MNKERYIEVLDQLDEHAQPCNMNFPLFGAGLYYVDSRLSVFADEKYWGLTIEVIEVTQGAIGHPCNINSVYRYGNCTRRPISLKENRFIPLTSDGEGGATFGEKTESLNINAKSIKINNKLVPIPHNLNIYYKKGIDLINKKYIGPRELLRVLTPEYREYFFLSDEEKKTDFVNSMPKLLQLEEWRHPLYNEENILELPSICEAFQMIAKVIATCDPCHYRPTEKPNTHWSNWLIADKYL